MFEHDFTLSPADQLKTLTSIAFVKDSGNTENYFAVSGVAIASAVVPEPSSFALGILGLLSLGFVGWRRRRVR